MNSLLKSLLPIALFGLIGIFARYFFQLGVNKLFPTAFPFATFFINILATMSRNPLDLSRG